ncbi:MAG: helix-turn-helix transcriptional regulator [Dehalococcoidia bacterium]|nr:helix-turn-helix transcriptional regulator [Dehalococcoidia bacterium]
MLRHDANDEPCYVISVAAKLLGIHAQTLRYYERVGLIAPSRTQGNIRLYSEGDLLRLRKVKQLMDELGVNLAGAEVIMRMRERIEEMEERMREMEREVTQLRQAQGR